MTLLERELGLERGSRILDVPCGSGRHSLELAERGHRVLGIDISSEAVQHARAAGAGMPDLEFVVADMRDLPRDGTFDAVFCLGNSFGYLEIDGVRDFVAGLAASLRPGGAAAIDFNAAAESVLPGFDGRPRTMRAGDVTAQATTEYDAVRSRLISGYAFRRGDQETTVTALHHVYTVAQLTQLLAEAGFANLRCYDGPGGDPFRLG